MRPKTGKGFSFCLGKDEVGVGAGAPPCAQGTAIFLFSLSETWGQRSPSPPQPEEAAGRVPSESKQTLTTLGAPNTTGLIQVQGESPYLKHSGPGVLGSVGGGNICTAFTIGCHYSETLPALTPSTHCVDAQKAWHLEAFQTVSQRMLILT